MVFAQIAANNQRAIQRGKRSDAPTQPTYTERRVVFCVTQPVINAVGTDATNQRTGKEQLFNGTVRTGQQADGICAMLRLDISHAIRHILQRGLPINSFPLASLLQHRLGETLGAVQCLVGKTIAVGNPTFVDRFVLKWNDAHHAVILHLHHQVGTCRVMWTDRAAARHFPRASAVTERLAGQGANGANINHVARQLGIDCLADERFDLSMLTAVRHTQFHLASNFLSETDAPCAMDAAAHFLHGHQWADIFVRDHALFFLVARGRAAVTHRQILKLAFAALIANGAVQRMVDQQELHDRLLRLDGLVRLCPDHHALCHRRCAGWHGLGSFFNFNQTHATAGRDGEFFVITKVRDIDARFLCSVHYHAAGSNFYFFAVEFDFNHGISRIQAASDALASILIMRSNSGRKCLIIARTGMAAASPNAQMVRPMMFSATLSNRFMSAGRPSPL